MPLTLLSEQLFSGPVAESLPTSISAFSHRRQRADSVTSFTYYNVDEDEADEDEAESVMGYGFDGATPDVDDIPFDLEADFDEQPVEEEESSGAELESGNGHSDYAMRRRSSTYSRSSVHARLLRTTSDGTHASIRGYGRLSQKLHMVNEDLTIVIAGFRTSPVGYILYVLLCVSTFGLAYLLLRWLPRWLVRMIGQPCPLAESQWVVLEVRPLPWLRRIRAHD